MLRHVIATVRVNFVCVRSASNDSSRNHVCLIKILASTCFGGFALHRDIIDATLKANRSTSLLLISLSSDFFIAETRFQKIAELFKRVDSGS